MFERRPGGAQAQGFVVAQVAAEVVSIVYVYSDDATVLDQWITRMTAEAQALLAAAPSS